jgi:hypothetical protein
MATIGPGRRSGWAPQKRCPPAILAPVTILLLLLLAAVARGEQLSTAQARADDGTFMPYLPAQTRRAGLCIVDSGNDENPDTTATTERTAIDNGAGEDASPTRHGTLLAMLAAAPANGWGMVGTAPNSIQVVSVRVVQPGTNTFSFNAYASGIDRCLQLRHNYDIKTINLSLGDAELPSSERYEELINAIQEATNYGVAVVAAAGNDDAGPLEYPAAMPSVLSVGASDTLTGGYCSFSNRGAGLRLIAPGCDLDAADPTSGTPDFNYWQGTSEASVIAAAALTALESYRPDLTPQSAEEALTSADNGALDIAAAFRNAGLAQLVDEAKAQEPREAKPEVREVFVSPPPLQQQHETAPAVAKAFPRPKARIARAKGHLSLVVTGRPSEAAIEVTYLARRAHSLRLYVLRDITGTFQTVRIPTMRIRQIVVRYIDPYDTSRESALKILTPPARKAKKPRRP